MLEEDDTIHGAGGGGGGGSNFTQTPDNLRSEDRYEGVLGLGHGRWKGLTKGLESLKIEGTPFDDGTGKSNFKDWRVAFADGDPALHPQKPQLALGASATPVTIGVPLSNLSGTGTPVVRTVNNTGAHFIDLRFVVNQLYSQTKKGIFADSMRIRIRMKPSGNANWIDVLVDTTGSEPPYNPGGNPTDLWGVLEYWSRSYYDGAGNRSNTGITSGALTISGKTTSPYVKEVRIAVPNSGNYANKAWDIECTLLDIESVDNDPNFEKRQVTWESAAAVFAKEMGGTEAWRGQVWLTMLGTASDRISGIPQVYGEYDCKIVDVPPSNVFDPDTRQYTGTVWDGSWAKAWTNDPAWVINDAIVDPLAGVSATAPGSYLNKWDALELSKYCSELVRNGDASLITNGNGDTLTGWTSNSFANPSLVGGRIRITNNGSGITGAANIRTPVTTVVGKKYAIRATITSGTSPGRVFVGSAAETSDLYASAAITGSNVPVSGTFVATTTTSWIHLSSTDFTINTFAEFDFVEVTETHPRFSLNVVADQPQKADELILNLAGAVGARAWDAGGGEWRCKLDKMETPAAIFTEENIIGEFSYSHTDVDTRYNDITMVFLNAEFDYREDRVRVFDQADIDAHGRKSTSIVALGCTNRQEAYRRAMLRLRASINEWRIVSFITNRAGRFLEPLQTILVADKSLGYEVPAGSTALPDTDERNHTTGRIIGMDAPRTTITLRDPLRLEPGASYQIALTVPNPNYTPNPSSEPAHPDWDKPTVVITRAVAVGSPRGDVNTITLTSALPADTPVNAPIALDAVGLPTLPVTYRIVGLALNEDRETVSISAIAVDTGKWAASDAVNSSEIEAQQPEFTCPPPTAPASGVMNLRSFVGEYSFNRILEIDWVRPNSAFVVGYEVRLRLNDGPVQLFTTTDTRMEIQNPEFGEYDVEIVSIDRRGQKSQPLVAASTIDEASNLRAIGYLTNETHTVPADASGNVTSYTGASGQFHVFIGTIDVTAGCVFSISANPQALSGPFSGSVLSSSGAYSVTGGFDVGENAASVTILATHTASGFTVTKTFSLAKSLTGSAGNAKTMLLATSHYMFIYGDSATVPNTQTTTLTATRINPGAATTLWTIFKADGVTAIATNQTATQLQTSGYCTRISDDQITINQTQFDNLLDNNATTGLIVRALYSDNASLLDQVSIVAISNGTSSLNAYLTRPAGVVAALADGTGGDFSNANGNVKVFKAGVDVSASATYSIIARTGGLNAGNSSINAAGAYTVTGCDQDQGSMTIQVSYQSQTLTLVYSITKTRPNAVITLTGSANSFIFIDGVPVDLNAAISITATKQGTGEALSWSSTPPVTLTGTGDSRTLTLANFGTNLEVTVKATGTITGAIGVFTIRRVDQSTPGDSVIPDGSFTRADILPTATPWSRTGGFSRVARYL